LHRRYYRFQISRQALAGQVEFSFAEARSKIPKEKITPVNPAELGARKIGHFGFFSAEHRDTLWRGAAEWLDG
jgi:hypothetical protein